MAIDSLVRDGTQPDYINLALLNNEPNLNNELELDTKPNLNLGNGN